MVAVTPMWDGRLSRACLSAEHDKRPYVSGQGLVKDGSDQASMDDSIVTTQSTPEVYDSYRSATSHDTASRHTNSFRLVMFGKQDRGDRQLARTSQRSGSERVVYFVRIITLVRSWRHQLCNTNAPQDSLHSYQPSVARSFSTIRSPCASCSTSHVIALPLVESLSGGGGE
jgi:hypothetical protein